MSIVNIRNIELVNNPAKFDDEYHFRIKFEAIAPLEEDLEWRLIYVGSATGEEYDQELDSCMVGPIPAGINAFDFQAPAPAHHLLPSVEPDEVLGVTVIIITASYRDKEFVRVGYYVNVYYDDEELKENPPATVQWDKLLRSVLIEKPKVTRFQNPWDSAPAPSAFDNAPSAQPASASASASAPSGNGFGAGFQQNSAHSHIAQPQPQHGFLPGFGGAGQGGGGGGMVFDAPVPQPVRAAAGPAGQQQGMEVDVA